MDEPNKEEIIVLVNSIFKVNNFTKTEFSLEFEIGDLEFKTKFEELARKLEGLNYLCKLEKTESGISLIIQKFSRKDRKWLNSSWVPRALFLIVIGFVLFDGYKRTEFANSVIDYGDPLEIAALYTLALLGILGVHELGHIIAAKRHKLKTTWPYFLPGIPVFGIPTFGAVIQSRGSTINREILFDVAIAGPIAGLVIAIIVSIYAGYTAPILEEEIGVNFFEDTRINEWTLGEPLLLTASLAMFGKGNIYQNTIYMTPFVFAAWVGFLLTFVNLLPAWHLDGGHLARTLINAKLHLYATYGSIAVLVLLNFWPMALLILMFVRKNPSATPLDDISPLSKNRKISYIGIIILAILCAPIPTNPFWINFLS